MPTTIEDPIFNFSSISRKSKTIYTIFHPLTYPLKGGIYQNSFLGDVYVTVALCYACKVSARLKIDKVSYKLSIPFYPLGGRINLHPLLADACVVLACKISARSVQWFVLYIDTMSAQLFLLHYVSQTFELPVYNV